MKHYIFIMFFNLLNLVIAQDGMIDPGFGTDGKIAIHIPDLTIRSKALLVLDDDSFLVGINLYYNHFGNLESRGFNIYKYDKNGLPDTNFGNDGVLFFPNEALKRSFVISLDRYNDKIFVHYLFKGVNTMSIISFSGEILKTFEIDGGINYYPNHIKFQPGQKFIVSGTRKINGIFTPNLQRYSFDGQKDMSFGTAGEVIFEEAQYTYINFRDFDLEPSGKIVVVGDASSSGQASRPFVLRLDADGHPDTSFATQGENFFRILDNSDYGICNNVKVLSDNKIIVSVEGFYVGGTGGLWGIKPAVVKFDSDGSFDTSFGDDGKYIFETYHDANDSFRCMKVQPDGKILIGGGSSYPYPVFDTDYYLTRLNSDGSLDTDFANDGFFVTDFNGQHETCYIFNIQLQNDAILALGIENTYDDFNYDASVIRFKAPSLTEVEKISKIYPNPFDNQIVIEKNFYFDKIELYDILGQLVVSENFDEVKDYIFDLNSLSKGVYHLVLYHKNQMVEHKKMIKR